MPEAGSCRPKSITMASLPEAKLRVASSLYLACDPRCLGPLDAQRIVPQSEVIGAMFWKATAR